VAASGGRAVNTFSWIVLWWQVGPDDYIVTFDGIRVAILALVWPANSIYCLCEWLQGRDP
jgi:hypothetical protein